MAAAAVAVLYYTRRRRLPFGPHVVNSVRLRAFLCLIPLRSGGRVGWKEKEGIRKPRRWGPSQSTINRDSVDSGPLGLSFWGPSGRLRPSHSQADSGSFPPLRRFLFISLIFVRGSALDRLIPRQADLDRLTCSIVGACPTWNLVWESHARLPAYATRLLDAPFPSTPLPHPTPHCPFPNPLPPRLEHATMAPRYPPLF